VDGNLPTDFSFTGQVGHELTGLIYYNARWYDPYLTRWLQPDTIVPGPSNPQALNRYSYVLNDPIKYTDPSGHYYCTGGELDAAACYAWVERMLLGLEKSGATGADLAKRFRERDAALMATIHPGFQFDFTSLVSGGMVIGNTLSLNTRYASGSLDSQGLGLVGHELTHLVKQDKYRNTTRGEAEAYATQGQILLDLGEKPWEIPDKALKLDLSSAEDLAEFKEDLVSWALTVDVKSAAIYWITPTGDPSNHHDRQGPTPHSRITTPVTPVTPRPRQTPQ
jgi:RHS repeat-associated protein